MSVNRPRTLIAFGMLLGASIGFADGVLGLCAWRMLGQPDFYIRRDWGEVPHVILLSFCGTFAGIVYSGFLIRTACACGEKLRIGRIYCGSLALAIPVFFCVHYIVIANRLSLFMGVFIPEISVFLLSIILAEYLGKEASQCHSGRYDSGGKE